MQFYKPRPTGHREKHLNTRAAMICGLVGAQHVHLPSMAAHAPSNGARQERVIKRVSRFLLNDAHTLDGWFLPVARELLTSLAAHPLEIVMDGSVVGRGCMALRASVVAHGRALPLGWMVVKGHTGHFPQTAHQALRAQIIDLVPPAAHVIFLGDGEFDGTDLQADLRSAKWQYVCRPGANITLTAFGLSLSVGEIQPKRGELLAISPAWMTAEQYGPISLLALWEQKYEQPIYLVTNMHDLDEAMRRDQKRASIETFFSDHKSRGFPLDTSHLSHPQRLCRLLIASCLAYIWLVYLGVCALNDEWRRLLHRRDRCDLSLFRRGLRLLARCLADHRAIPDGLIVPASLPAPPIRTFRKQAA